ncbi:squalene synthase HpnC [Rhodoferax sp.]|uniref:squalene synthase HpnC n=1 Tax=Rhodoferax sp. TaxID=50421 RepID=UPI00260A5F7F|nr:squalene synthase HpnC [Rhodoferax sp.]MDD2919920.1 squalene synthase HpnC [Rhodoferax sp.]
MNTPPDNTHTTSTPVEHYENFPVASWLCPPRLRPAIAAIYHFARTADDLADEGDASAAQRLDALSRYRADLLAIASEQAHSGQWPQVFEPLREVLRAFSLPVPLLTDLLDAFAQDVRYTAAQRRYPDDAELLDYCTRSANPVGRLLLHLYGISDNLSLTQSDQICSALQLINFWQDVSTDVARGRWYPSVQTMAAHGVLDADLQPGSHSDSATRLITAYATSARALMQAGAPLARRIPGRAGWELRLVVQGGLRILDKIEALRFATWRTRPKLTARDVPGMLWRALWMR